jgi:hypothetical protein
MMDYDPNKISVFNYLTIIMQQDLNSRISNKDP